MKKKSLLVILFLITIISFNTAMAGGKGSENSFDEGKVVVSGGYGAPWLSASVFSNYSSNTDYAIKSIGPVYMKLEYGVTNWVGIGFNWAYANADINYTVADGNYIDKHTVSFATMSFLGRVNFHFLPDNEKIDLYGGLGMGYRSGGWAYKSVSTNPNYVPSNGTTPTIVPIGFEITLGGRYYFTPNIGMYAEIGLAKSPFQIGLCAKF
jgi:hypothetical protein